jgi:hypothetical protein
MRGSFEAQMVEVVGYLTGQQGNVFAGATEQGAPPTFET